jgi:hypothetical protein
VPAVFRRRGMWPGWSPENRRSCRPPGGGIVLRSRHAGTRGRERGGGNRAYAREIDRSWRLGRTEPRRISERAARCFGRATKKEIQLRNYWRPYFVVFC